MINPSTEYTRFTLEGKKTLVDVYRYSIDNNLTPADTVAILADEIGKDSAAEIIAVMVLCKGEWDKRISPSSRRWARETAEHDEAELAQIPGLYYCEEIHPAHMDQLAGAIRTATR